MSSTWQSMKPPSGNIFAGSLPVAVWSIMLPSSEWSSGPYTPPGCTITIGAPLAIRSSATWCARNLVSS